MSGVKFDLLNQRIERLTVIERLGSRKIGRNKQSSAVFWLCKCDCGNLVEVMTGNLTNRNTKSCGCLNLEKISERSKTHGMSDTKVYNAWRSMLDRCENPNNISYQNYGGRGISVCEQWHKFENFINDMGHRPDDGWSVERIDNDGNYCPENCKWATQSSQCNNTRRNRYLTYKGETKSVTEWARIFGLNNGYVITRRINRGWSIERAITTKCRN